MSGVAELHGSNLKTCNSPPETMGRPDGPFEQDRARDRVCLGKVHLGQ
jgi:hypothetical protein